MNRGLATYEVYFVFHFASAFEVRCLYLAYQVHNNGYKTTTILTIFTTRKFEFTITTTTIVTITNTTTTTATTLTTTTTTTISQCDFVVSDVSDVY